MVAVSRRNGTIVRTTVANAERQLLRTLRRKTGIFGSGHQARFVLRDRPQLVGTDVVDSLVDRTQRGHVHLNGEHQLADVQTSSGFVPARITGTIDDGLVAVDDELAIAVNGRIAAVTRPFREDGRLRFGALTPPSRFVDRL